MHLLSHEESASATDGFLLTIYGEEILRKWKELKEEMEFVSEREYMSWLIDVAYQYRAGDEGVMGTDEAGHTTYEHDGSMCGGTKEDSSHGMDTHMNVKTESDELPHPMPMQSYSRPQAAVRHLGEPQGQGASDEIYLSGDEESVQHNTSVSQDYSSGLDSINQSHFKHQTNSLATLEAQVEHFPFPTRSSQSVKKSLSCPHCNYICAQPAHLQSHLIRKHDYDSKYMCNWCGKKENTPSTLKKHEDKCKYRDGGEK